MALSASRELFQSKGEQKTKSVLAANATQFYRGSFVMKNSAGLAVPASVAAGNHGIVGVSLEETLTANATTYIKVQYGLLKIPAAAFTGETQADVGEWAYGVDDETLIDLAAGATNAPAAGYIDELDTDGGIWVDIDPKANADHGVHA